MRSKGDLCEKAAVELIRSCGLNVVARNFTARTGEIDIIALDSDCLVFLEVRGRSNPRFAGAAASVDRRKQQRLLRTAQVFLQTHPRWAKTRCRFDVIAFEPRQSGTDPGIQWIRGAFTA